MSAQPYENQTFPAGRLSFTGTGQYVPLWFAASQMPPTAWERELARQIVGQGYTPTQADRLSRLLSAGRP